MLVFKQQPARWAGDFVPFVYYLFHTPKHEVPTGQIEAFRKALYLFAFSHPFSRYADSRLWKFIREEIRPLVDNKDYHFPFDRAVAWVDYWDGVTTGFNERLLNSNLDLTLHVLQNLSTTKAHYQRNAGQIDPSTGWPRNSAKTSTSSSTSPSKWSLKTA